MGRRGAAPCGSWPSTPALQALLDCAPSQWACYRFARQLRERDNWALDVALNDTLAALREQHPDMGENVAIDASDLPAYSNGQRSEEEREGAVYSDPDASWGHRSAVSTRAAGGFFGFKIDAAVDVATGLPLAWDVRTAKHAERNFALTLIDKAKRRGFKVGTAIMDRGYDGEELHFWCNQRGVAPVIALKTPRASSAALPNRRTAHTASGRSPGPTTSGRRPSGAARPANASPVRCGSALTVCTR
jgi:Transposase DDE domain